MNVTKIEATAQLECFVTKTADLATVGPKATLRGRFFDELLNGTGLNQAGQVYMDSNTVTASTRVTYDLAGSLTDIFGDTITFTRIKGIIVKNTSTLAARLKVGGGTDGAGTNAFDTWITSAAANGSEGVYVPKGGCFMLFSPDATAYAVTAATVDILAIEEVDAANGAFDLALIGCV